MKEKYTQALFFLMLISLFIISGCNSNDIKDNSSKETSSTTVHSKQNVKEKDTRKVEELLKSPKTGKKLIPATIVKNIDGDTVEIKLNGKVEKIRMLCVDTPETHHPRLGVQPFGPEAAAYTKKILSVGTKVEVETGIGDGRDKYGRLLAYIYVNGKMFNEMLLEQGLARVAYVYAPNTQYVDDFYAIQKEAQTKGIGIWSIENYAQEDGFHANNTKSMQGKNKNSNSPSRTSTGSSFQNNPKDDQETNLNCKGKIKGNANSHIYHVKGGAFYDTTKDNIVWFCSEKEAENAGYRKSKR